MGTWTGDCKTYGLTPVGSLGAFTFARCFLEAKPTTGTIIFTGATMSIKGSAKFGTMAPSKFALRALSQVRMGEFWRFSLSS